MGTLGHHTIIVHVRNNAELDKLLTVIRASSSKLTEYKTKFKKQSNKDNIKEAEELLKGNT
jgi:hypothetical protein